MAPGSGAINRIPADNDFRIQLKYRVCHSLLLEGRLRKKIRPSGHLIVAGWPDNSPFIPLFNRKGRLSVYPP
jgi:hypothetical protein